MSQQDPAHYYFAYGSNMNRLRVEKRKMQFDLHFGGVLEGYRLAFNKRSVAFPGAASANVMPAAESRVEGVLYRLRAPVEIEVMDVFEGHPERYRREQLPVICHEGVVPAWVYIANDEFVAHGLKPMGWYLEHLLLGRPHLSEPYYEELARTETLPNTEIEPEI